MPEAAKTVNQREVFTDELVRLKLIESEAGIFAYREWPDAPKFTFADDLGVRHSDYPVDSLNRRMHIFVTKDGLKFRLFLKDGVVCCRYVDDRARLVRDKDGRVQTVAGSGRTIEEPLADWNKKYKAAKQLELARLRRESGDEEEGGV